MSEPGRTASEWSGEALFRTFGLGFPEYFFYLLLHASRRRDAGLSDEMDRIDLTLPKWRALAVIRRLGACAMTELAQLSPVDRTTLTRTVDHLVEEGLVERSPSPADRRQVLLNLSPRGVVVADEARAINRAFCAKLLTGIPEEQRKVAMEVIQRIVDNLIDDDGVAYGVLTFRTADGS